MRPVSLMNKCYNSAFIVQYGERITIKGKNELVEFCTNCRQPICKGMCEDYRKFKKGLKRDCRRKNENR